jgi:hypothetical protein
MYQEIAHFVLNASGIAALIGVPSLIIWIQVEKFRKRRFRREVEISRLENRVLVQSVYWREVHAVARGHPARYLLAGFNRLKIKHRWEPNPRGTLCLVSEFPLGDYFGKPISIDWIVEVDHQNVLGRARCAVRGEIEAAGKARLERAYVLGVHGKGSAHCCKCNSPVEVMESGSDRVFAC